MSNSGVFGPTPEGIDLHQNQDREIFSDVLALMVLATLFVVVRIFTRIFARTGGMAADDYLIIVGWLFTTGTAMCCLISTRYGCGRHLWVVSQSDFESIFKILYSYVYLYATGVSFTKLSILLFYRRVFGVTKAFWICLSLVVGYWVAIIIAWINVCHPIHLFWYKHTTTMEGYCFNDSKFYFGNGIANMLIDICVLAYPVPIVWKLHMPKEKKLAVIAILMLGSFVCVASIVRIVNLNDLIHATDTTWTMGPVFVWSCVEPYVGILCACLPTFAPLVRIFWNKVRGYSANHQSGAGGNKSTGSGTGNLNSNGLRSKSAQWNKLGDSNSGSKNSRLRHDDEVELTYDITSSLGTNNPRTRTSDEELNLPINGIMVKNDVQWSSSSREV
ncbi:pth11-like integral membrane protein [Phlyctema vagabunda]|uniref:Pth11-like integral membrane protein n=1 Tax=Phlyctema vagabunda TaxID=108571 RepID=A0ABR4P3N5_9HELO